MRNRISLLIGLLIALSIMNTSCSKFGSTPEKKVSAVVNLEDEKDNSEEEETEEIDYDTSDVEELQLEDAEDDIYDDEDSELEDDTY